MTNNDDKRKESLHLNYAVITENIEQKSRVLDLGCGSGDLLKMLVEKKTLYRSGNRYRSAECD